MRTSGILLPLFSLPGRYGIGTMGQNARNFVDFAANAGQTYWQLLPVGPTGYGDSPYQSFSAFAGNPYFIDPDLLVQDGLLTAREAAAEAARYASGGPVDYAALYQNRPALLQQAAARLPQSPQAAAFGAFCAAQADWLEDYALFLSIKEELGQVGLAQWPAPLRRRDPAALADARQRLTDRIHYYKAVQYLFYAQWNALKAYANGKGVRIIGDIPIYVSPDSSDLWAAPELFQTNPDGTLHRVAGCPPDAFAADGQLWGNPLYHWPAHAADGYAWWVRRLRHAAALYDVVRIDHFRGFESYFSIPAGAKTAHGGSWQPGPGLDFIRAVRAALPDAAIIAEDLGYQTPALKAFLAASGFPGMKVLQFAFDAREASNYLPHGYTAHSVAYTGTHDNSTAQGWQTAAAEEDVALACDYLDCSREQLTEKLIRAVLGCVSDTAVIPLQDWLGLDDAARINTPGTDAGNWRWRLATDALTPALAGRIAALTRLYGRSAV